MKASWRLLIDDASSPARNMAVDEALLREVHEPVLRIYQWKVPAVSLGYFQPASVAPLGRSFVRRYTGGGLVDHAHDITYTIVLPRAHGWMKLSAPESYAEIHRGVLSVLAACGIPSELTAKPSPLESEACFRKPVLFDIMAGARKLAGAAQRRTREGMLHQGSILLADPAQNDRVRKAFPEAFSSYFDLEFVPGKLTSAEANRAANLERERYSSEAWNRLR
jgi:lipoate-protein ligase A